MRNPCKGCQYVQSGLIRENGTRHYYMCNSAPAYDCEKRKEYREFRYSKRKYVKGEQITSIDELMKYDMVFLMGAAKHYGFVHSMTLRTISHMIKRGMVSKAIKKESEV